MLKKNKYNHWFTMKKQCSHGWHMCAMSNAPLKFSVLQPRPLFIVVDFFFYPRLTYTHVNTIVRSVMYSFDIVGHSRLRGVWHTCVCHIVVLRHNEITVESFDNLLFLVRRWLLSMICFIYFFFDTQTYKLN